MLVRGYKIDISKDSVEVRRDGSTVPLDERVVGGLLSSGVSVVLGGATIFLPGRHDSLSVWENLMTHRWPSSDFVSALIMAIFMGILCGSLFLYGVRQLFPNGEILHCDRSTLTVSKIPWFSLRGKWKIQSFPVADVSNSGFFIHRSGRSVVSGLRFLASGHKHKIFSGIEAPEADEILKGLAVLGADVDYDYEMRQRVQDSLSARGSQFDNDSSSLSS